jgi:CrcB protein
MSADGSPKPPPLASVSVPTPPPASERAGVTNPPLASERASVSNPSAAVERAGGSAPPLAAVLGVIALGGVVGSLARYGLAEAFPHDAGSFPWATFATNVLGCFAIGVLLAALTPLSHPLFRPFLGTGILGGFTTFSTFAVDTDRLLPDHVIVALLYFFGTLAAAMVATILGELAVKGARR